MAAVIGRRLGCGVMVAALVLLSAGSASAAGGHHAVDDAGILGPGECEQESWYSRAQGGGQLVHAGAGCRVGPIELAAAGDLARSGGRSETAWTVQAKWATEVADGVSIGLAVQPALLPQQSPRFAGTTLAALATWKPRDDLAFHLNIGRDFVNQGPDGPRNGIAAEWAPVARWWLLAERYIEGRTHFVRAGARWVAGSNWSLDFSHAHRLSGPIPSRWTLGLTFAFGGED
ncbi:hypothetical protein WG902_18675 [Ramlibacter sp. PS3R-8]|uniref:hypothetical protein n=1 Tax=Ramlibacter sp. PS3R-8 TaxID=3133437 RepID=UPI00309A9C14